jgi:hypothetical protein
MRWVSTGGDGISPVPFFDAHHLLAAPSSSALIRELCLLHRLSARSGSLETTESAIVAGPGRGCFRLRASATQQSIQVTKLPIFVQIRPDRTICRLPNTPKVYIHNNSLWRWLVKHGNATPTDETGYGMLRADESSWRGGQRG